MKILHLADLHLGKFVNGLSMIDDQRYVLNSVVDVCKGNNINHIIIAGDVFDRSIPSEEAVSLLNEFLSKVVLVNNIKVYMISGNHDSRERLSLLHELLESTGLYIDCFINNDLSMNKHTILEDGLKINIYQLPYIYPSEIKIQSNDNDIKDYEASIKKIIDSTSINKDEINIINTHYFINCIPLK